MISPTVGRVVWYHRDKNQSQPFAAFIAHVWSDTCVNLAYFDANGIAQSATSVLLLQDGNERPSHSFAEWMPYQKGQAAKTEQLEKQITEGGHHEH